jgi:hypothetical protein
VARRALAALAAALSLPFASLAAAPPLPAQADTGTGTPTARAACTTAARWHCRAESISLGASGTGEAWTPRTTPSVYSAHDLEAIYGTAGRAPAGGTPTIAVVDAYNDPTAAADLATYRATMGLRPCTVASGCLRIVNWQLDASPLPADSPTDAASDWSIEDALDLDAASAICPSCHLMLVEADDPNGDTLLAGARNAAAAVHYVSMSWGGPDGGSVEDPFFADTSALFVAASGDDGYESVADAPSTLAHVVSVGGVSLPTPGSAPSVWNDIDGAAGSSCSTRVPTPALQAAFTTGCSFKASSDLSALADPETGMAAYDSYGSYGQQGGWFEMGGTSAAAPLVTAMFALMGNHTDPGAPYQELAAYPRLLEDVTTGSNGSCGTVLCDAGTSWDGPTGIGMPLSPEALGRPLGHLRMGTHRLRGTRGTRLAVSVRLPATVPDAAGVAQVLASSTARVSGLPAGLSAHVSHGVLRITGVPTRAGSGRARLALSGRTPARRLATGSAVLRWTISSRR